MARALRILIPNGWYHVFQRGTQRREIFLDDRDRMHFVELLGEAHERYRFMIHAFALMTTHYHAIVQTPDANLSAGMQWLHLSHAAWLNARHGTTGPFWQGRFRSVPVEEGAWASELSLYVHLNPLNIQAFGLGKQGKRAEALGLRPPKAAEVSGRLRALRNYRRRGDWGTPLVMLLARRCRGMKLREIDDALGGKDYAAVSDRLCRFERQIAVNRKLERVCKDAMLILNLEI